MKILGLIPARYESTRFPGKPLVDINGKSMIRRVYEQSSKAFDEVYVATDDERIFSHVSSFSGKVVMTSKEHQSGTDRCAEAADKVSVLTGNVYDIIVNIQGDEPFIQPEQLNLLVSCFEDPEVQISTLVKKIAESEDIFNPNKPKVILDSKSRAIYFSRSPIPFLRNYPQQEWINKGNYYKHIGLYAYRFETLKVITKLSLSPLEISESLEQLRWIENGYKIGVKITDQENISIDTPEDLEKL